MYIYIYVDMLILYNLKADLTRQWAGGPANFNCNVIFDLYVHFDLTYNYLFYLLNNNNNKTVIKNKLLV